MKRAAALSMALLLMAAALPALATAATEFGFRPGSVGVSESSTVAGAHPDLTVEFEMNSEENGEPVATTDNIKIAMPAGLTGNPNTVAHCTLLQLMNTDVESPGNESSCPPDSQVGVTEVILFNQNGGTQSLVEPIFNMEPPNDGHTVARLGFYAKFFPTLANIRLRSDGDYGLTTSIEGIGSFIPLLSATTTIWGVPADKSHDPLRITPYEALACGGSPCTAPGGEPRESGLVPAPFLSNATRCGVPQHFELSAISYAEPNLTSTESIDLPGLTGCGKLGFAPSFSAVPTSREAAAPTGLDVDLSVPQDETVGGRSSSQLRDAKVVLPRGMTIATGAADGLASCSAQQAGYKSTESAHCPAAAKIGTAEIDVPELSRVIEGSVYQRTPEPGHLFRIWLTADELGIHLALPGEIELNPDNGQITSLFLETPQAPVRDFKLHFKSGPRAPLANPSRCGQYQTAYEFTPWNGGAPVLGEAPMTIDQGCAGGGFDPKLSAGSTRSIAGAFAPFLTQLTRQAAEQNISGVEVTLPRGVLAKLAGVPLCDAAAAGLGACADSTQIGAINVAAGPGPSPLWLPQPGKPPTAVYLAGPYKGAPYSLVIKVPAQAGPFDLGDVVTRAGIYVDPETVQATVRSDPLPQFLQGVPVSYRTIQIGIDRQGFAVNPTNCAKKGTTAVMTSAQGASASATSPFQVGECQRLPFKPKLSLRLKGKSNRGAHPSLRAILTMPPRSANIARASVALPSTEFIDQAHFRTICTRVQFAADQCPAGSTYGQATATSPLLGYPVHGPVYLRSGPHKLPDLALRLRGPGSQSIEAVVTARVDSVNGGLRTTFESVPDVPISKVVVSMQGGHKGLFQNSTNICREPHRATVGFTAQSGKTNDFKTPLQGCPKTSHNRQGKR
jgi:hypothetical protein